MAEFQYLDGGNSEVQDMQAEAYLYASSGTTGIAATGVIEGLVVTQTSTASGSVLIAAGACVNQASLGQGASRLINPSQKTLDVFTANPVGGLPRNDIVVFDSVTKLIAVIVGTPNATPTDPTVPATADALARLRNLASATTIPTAQIDDLRVFTGLRGTSWAAYSPVWSQVGGTILVIGNGSLTGRWVKDGSGRVTCAGVLTRGSTSNVGTAIYLFSLPTPSQDYNLVGGTGIVTRGTEIPCVVRGLSSTLFTLIAAGGRIGSAYPGAWAAGDTIQWSVTYEAA